MHHAVCQARAQRGAGTHRPPHQASAWIRAGIQCCHRGVGPVLEGGCAAFVDHCTEVHTCDTRGDTPGLSPVLQSSPAPLPRQNGEQFVLLADLLSFIFRMGRNLELGSSSGERSKVFPGGLRSSSPTEPRPSARRSRACGGCSGLETGSSPR